METALNNLANIVLTLQDRSGFYSKKDIIESFKDFLDKFDIYLDKNSLAENALHNLSTSFEELIRNMRVEDRDFEQIGGSDTYEIRKYVRRVKRFFDRAFLTYAYAGHLCSEEINEMKELILQVRRKLGLTNEQILIPIIHSDADAKKIREGAGNVSSSLSGLEIKQVAENMGIPRFVPKNRMKNEEIPKSRTNKDKDEEETIAALRRSQDALLAEKKNIEAERAFAQQQAQAAQQLREQLAAIQVQLAAAQTVAARAAELEPQLAAASARVVQLETGHRAQADRIVELQRENKRRAEEIIGLETLRDAMREERDAAIFQQQVTLAAKQDIERERDLARQQAQDERLAAQQLREQLTAVQAQLAATQPAVARAAELEPQLAAAAARVVQLETDHVELQRENKEQVERITALEAVRDTMRGERDAAIARGQVAQQAEARALTQLTMVQVELEKYKGHVMRSQGRR